MFVATVSLTVLLALRPLSTSRALGIWIVIVTALALLLLVRRSRATAPHVSRFDAALQGWTTAASEPVELLRMERELELGIASAGSAHHRLLPLLRAAAAARLASRHGIDLDRRPDAARALLGEEAWEWVRPDRPEPADRFGRGVPRESVTAVIERVESL
ncbi:MAG TPA: hypothetical protein VFJ11_07145 [Gaiellaceae bacterium]|nr:hypothetical protein [Gaiellaceae bacterium]